MRRFLRFSGQSPSSPGLGRSSPCHWAWWCGGTGKRKVARAVTARTLLSSVEAQQPQAEPVLRIVPPLRNAQPRFGRQRNETGRGVLVAVSDLHRPSSEEPRVGKECVSSIGSSWSQHTKKKKPQTTQGLKSYI